MISRDLRSALIGLALIGLFVTGCVVIKNGSGTGKIRVADAWVTVTPQEADKSAVYMSITADEDDRLVAVKVTESVSPEAQIHEIQTENDVAKHHHIEGLDLPAGQKVELAPGGYHIMLTDLVSPLTAGQEVDLTLRFDKAEDLALTVLVKQR